VIPEQDTKANAERAAFIHREILQVCVLMLVAVAAFFVTRAVAANNRDMGLRDAGEWYRRGQRQLQEGRVAAAIEAFRHATVRDRTNKNYVLALARALAGDHEDDAARGVLLTLRESAPEDAEINLELARLAAHRHDVTAALRFYHNALYAPWPTELADARRRVRIELIRFLLTHDQSSRALSELLAVASDLPDQLAAHLQIAQLFAEAGDDSKSLEQFQRALQLEPGNGAALAGAGERAFRVGQYVGARSYLRRAPRDLDDVAGTLDIVERVLSEDPLANRIGATERRRRLTSGLDYARRRLAACIARRENGHATSEEVSLQAESEAFPNQLKPGAGLGQDIIEAGVDLMDRIARHVVQVCGPATARDRALILIGREHGVDSQ
jgi:Tfp pilus assembly protein PilF